MTTTIKAKLLRQCCWFLDLFSTSRQNINLKSRVISSGPKNAVLTRINNILFLVAAVAGLASVNAVPAWADAVATAAGTDTYTAAYSPPITSYVTDQIYRVKFTNANTTQFNDGPEVTIDINGLGPKVIKKMWIGSGAGNDSKTRLLTSDIVPNHVALLWYDGTDMILLNPAVPTMMAETRKDGGYIGLVYGGTAWDNGSGTTTWDPVLYFSSNATNGNTRIDPSKPSIALGLEGAYRASPNGTIYQELNLDTVRATGEPERWFGFAKSGPEGSQPHNASLALAFRSPGAITFDRYGDTGTPQEFTRTTMAYLSDYGFGLSKGYRLAAGDYFFYHDGTHFYLDSHPSSTQIGARIFSVDDLYPTLALGIGLARGFKEISTTPYQAIDSDDIILVNTNAGVITINLPYPWPAAGKELTIKDNDGSAAVNNIIVNAGNARAIEGSQTKVINANWGSLKILWNNSRAEWRVIP